jgi:hypothetical protein
MERLKSDETYHREDWAYFNYPQNKELHQQSDREAEQLANASQKKWEEASGQVALHRQSCPICSIV